MPKGEDLLQHDPHDEVRIGGHKGGEAPLPERLTWWDVCHRLLAHRQLRDGGLEPLEYSVASRPDYAPHTSIPCAPTTKVTPNSS